MKFWSCMDREAPLKLTKTKIVGRVQLFCLKTLLVAVKLLEILLFFFQFPKTCEKLNSFNPAKELTFKSTFGIQKTSNKFLIENCTVKIFWADSNEAGGFMITALSRIWEFWRQTWFDYFNALHFKASSPLKSFIVAHVLEKLSNPLSLKWVETSLDRGSSTLRSTSWDVCKSRPRKMRSQCVTIESCWLINKLRWDLWCNLCLQNYAAHIFHVRDYANDNVLFHLIACWFFAFGTFSSKAHLKLQQSFRGCLPLFKFSSR